MRWRRLFLGFLFGVLPAAGHAQAQVQQCKPFFDVSSASYTSMSCSFPAPTTTGDSVLLGVGFGTNNPTITAKDDAGDAFYVACRIWDSNHRQGLAVLRAKSALGPSNKVTVNFSSAVQYVSLAGQEVSGLGTDETGGCKQFAGSGPAPAGGKVTLTASDYVFTAALEDAIGHNVTLTSGLGFTLGTDLDAQASYADAYGIFPPGTAQGAWMLSPSSDWLAITYAIHTAAPVPVTVTAQFVYDDGTPFKGTAVLYVEGTVEAQAGSAVLDQNGVAALTFTPDTSKTYHAVLLDSAGNTAFELWSIALGSALAQQELASLAAGQVKITIAKATGKIAGVVKQ